MKRHKLQPLGRGSSFGFTIIELMIATAVFSVVMLVVAAGILSFSNDYIKGVNNNTTQQLTRSVMGEVTQAIQFGTNFTGPIGTGEAQRFCINNTAYTFITGKQAKEGGGLIKDNSVCGSDDGSPFNITMPDVTAPGTTQLLRGEMRVSQFEIVQIGPNTYNIDLRIIFGDNDVLFDVSQPDLDLPATPEAAHWAQVGCLSNTGSEFCSVSELHTTVQQRISN